VNRDGRRAALLAALGTLGVALAVVAGGCAARGPAVGASHLPAGVVVVEETGATAVALVVVTPGSGWELPGTEGLTLLAAHALLEQARPRLEPLGARAGVECQPAAFVFTLLAPPASGAGAATTFLAVLFGAEPDSGAVAVARARLAPALALERGHPAGEAWTAIRRAAHGDPLDPAGWGGPACGLPGGADRFRLSDVRAARHRFDAERSVAALVGPAGVAAGVTFPARIGVAGSPLDAPRRVVEGREHVERNTVTAWLTLAFPFHLPADLEALDLLGFLLQEYVAPTLERPEVYNASYTIEEHGAGGTLTVHLVLEPGVAGAYARRLETHVRRLAGAGPDETGFARLQRRHAGQRLARRAAPEARARDMALARAAGRAAGDGWPVGPSPGPARVRAAAAALGSPARAVVGPAAARDVVLLDRDDMRPYYDGLNDHRLPRCCR
jgi:hypothetical protein